MIDRVDKEILKLLQQNGRLSLKTIAEKTFLSSPAVSARIERMENDGIILGYGEPYPDGIPYPGVHQSERPAGGQE